jgi:hypothetical protein
VKVLSQASLSDRKCAVTRVEGGGFVLVTETWEHIAEAATPRELVDWALYEKGALSVRHSYDLAAYEAAQKK